VSPTFSLPFFAIGMPGLRECNSSIVMLFVVAKRWRRLVSAGVAERIGASGGTARGPATNRVYDRSLIAPIRGRCAWSRADLCQWRGLILALARVSRLMRYPALLSVAGLALTVGHFAGEASVPEATRQFQSFMEAPPPIAELIYEEHVPGRAVTWGMIRWQTNGYLIRRAAAKESLYGPYDSQSDIDLTGRFGTHYWHIGDDSTVGTKLMLWDDTDSPSDATNLVATIHKFSLMAVEHVLSMGIPLLGVSQVRWNGLSFSFHSAAANSTVLGSLATEGDGRPAEVNLLVSHDSKLRGVPKEIPGKLTYTYNIGDMPSWFPAGMVRSIVDPRTHEARTVNMVTVHRLALGSVAQHELVPERFLDKPARAIITITNGMPFYAVGSATGQLLSANDPRTRLIADRPKYRRAYAISAGILFLIPAFVAIWVATKHKTGRIHG
jgi:hypothetical protein